MTPTRARAIGSASAASARAAAAAVPSGRRRPGPSSCSSAAAPRPRARAAPAACPHAGRAPPRSSSPGPVAASAARGRAGPAAAGQRGGKRLDGRRTAAAAAGVRVWARAPRPVRERGSASSGRRGPLLVAAPITSPPDPAALRSDLGQGRRPYVVRSSPGALCQAVHSAPAPLLLYVPTVTSSTVRTWKTSRFSGNWPG